jgi:hypothetical protein
MRKVQRICALRIPYTCAGCYEFALGENSSYEQMLHVSAAKCNM